MNRVIEGRPTVAAQEPEPALRQQGLAALTKTLLERLSLLVSKEVQLARAEVIEDLKHTKVAGIRGGAAVTLGIASLVCALIAVVEGLGHLMPRWLAAVGLCAVFGALAAVIGLGAYREIVKAKPRRTMREAKATVRMLSERHA